MLEILIIFRLKRMGFVKKKHVFLKDEQSNSGMTVMVFGGVSMCLGLIIDSAIYMLWYLPTQNIGNSWFVDFPVVIGYFKTIPGMVCQVPIVGGFLLSYIGYKIGMKSRPNKWNF